MEKKLVFLLLSFTLSGFIRCYQTDDALTPPDLPVKIIFRGNQETFNNKYYAANRGGSIWIKANLEQTGIDEEWQSLDLPDGLEGDVIEIALDNEYMIAINSEHDIYTMNNAMSDRSLFFWQKNWGPPFWLGVGMKLPEDIIKWDWSSVSPVTDSNWTDPAGNLFKIGLGRCSHIWTLNSTGQNLTMIDPWLPQDLSYEITTPYRGRFRAVNVSSSGSFLFIINEYGDMFTRFYDFDLGGNDPIFFQYSYYDQRGKEFPKMQLPSPPWIMHPKIKGKITDRISIYRIGKNCVHRTMRVEGMNEQGKTGYFEKDVTEMEGPGSWVFHNTGEPLAGTILENRDYDSSLENLGDNEDAYYSINMENVNSLPDGITPPGTITKEYWAGELLDFWCYTSPATLRIHVKGASFDLLLHTTDNIRQWPIERGLCETERYLNGNIEIPEELLNNLEHQDELVKAFIGKYLCNQRHTKVAVWGKTGRIRVVGYTFEWQFIR
ncbi:MAG: hypothetical protein CVV44_10205 [Spirochaetae bacterium HGW-Spirochaetae-1]|jgi:hypothetical protein|nr:MAG: hypothetical protein CVV44_10205 [Spirochaetae bacterium HGW-Spirochaetae-1]